MELNITIFIQVISLTVFFIFLSNVLFKPLHRLFEERKSETLGKKLAVQKILKNINKQEAYIISQKYLTLKKAKNIYNKLHQENMIKKKYSIKMLELKSQETYNKVILKLDNEVIVTKKELLKIKNDLVSDILQQLYKN